MRRSAFTAVFDACVLYPAPLRDFLIRLAVTGCFRARWSDRINEEWQRNLLASRPELSQQKLDHTARLMSRAVPDSLITGYENLIVGLTLPDPDDRHVLAAAIRGGASVIVTFNLKDFPTTLLAPYGIEPLHPDEFIEDLVDLDMAAVLEAARQQRSALKNPPKTVEAYIETLDRQGLVNASRMLRRFAAVL